MIFILNTISSAYSQEINEVRIKWKQLADLLEARWNLKAVCSDGKLYSIGGMKVEEKLTLLEVFDINTKICSKKAEIPEAGFYSGSNVFDNKIFVLDGAEEGEDHTDMFVYYPEKNKWGNATQLPYPVLLAGFTVNENKLYVIGGCKRDFKAVRTV